MVRPFSPLFGAKATFSSYHGFSWCAFASCGYPWSDGQCGFLWYFFQAHPGQMFPVWPHSLCYNDELQSRWSSAHQCFLWQAQEKIIWLGVIDPALLWPWWGTKDNFTCLLALKQYFNFLPSKMSATKEFLSSALLLLLLLPPCTARNKAAAAAAATAARAARARSWRGLKGLES